MKPIIGINLDIEAGPPSRASVQTNYLQAILQAGGIPLLLPPMPVEDLDVLLKSIQGLLLIRGRDYSPSLYGENAHDSVQLLDPRREEFDLRLIKQTMQKSDIPVLGICGGCQLLNISLGGSLIQDIKSHLPESAVVHTQSSSCGGPLHTHDVTFANGGLLSKI